ncbi:AAA family ATPase [Acinetobacter vivianii]|uniref:McrB family protein n=1 Tax=Acinetobacter vivianii TaxID=1776742 RepID=UPI002DB9960E|nr:AAA family ATPase [Acinetobacter vivianii]MEB6666333.1 AAA family ATPase [Acinetobacter vivianii]
MTSFRLKNLNDLIEECRQEYNNLPNELDIKITPELRKVLLEVVPDFMTQGGIEVSDYSITYRNSSGLTAILPSRWLWIASVFHQYSDEYFKYMDIVHGAKNNAGLRKDFLKDYPKVTEPASKTIEEKDFESEIINILTTKDSSTSTSNFTLVKEFIYNRSWWNVGSNGKTLDRHDAYDSSLLGATQVVVASSDKLVPLITSFSKSQKLQDALTTAINCYTDTTTSSAENIIYYGAPGTGKSFAIDKKINSNNSVRTVFHPETQYSDFVGCIKPSMGDKGIEYSFKKGPFIEALIKAINNPDQDYYLIIEEINRAPAAAVFGELFQLLDRDGSGKSSYTIDINDKDLLTIFNSETPGKFPDNKLYIPGNLSLYATMNSSDQAVMPLDTAFKRRWKFEYKPLDFSTSPSGIFEINTEDGMQTVNWAEFAQAINSILSLQSIPEDRHLGPWFVNDNEINSPENAKKTLSGKVLMYLWDDVLRHSERSALFHPDIKTFGYLVTQFNKGQIIFSGTFKDQLKEQIAKAKTV